MHRSRWRKVAFAVAILVLSPGAVLGQDKFRVRDVQIGGNGDTPRAFLLALLPFEAGSEISTEDLKRVQRRMRNSVLWQRAHVFVLPATADNNPRDVVVLVDEQEWNWLVFGVGYKLVAFRLTGDLDHFRYAVHRANDEVRKWVSGG
jgi:hypothetical protein